jgi:hypothetical protein
VPLAGGAPLSPCGCYLPSPQTPRTAFLSFKALPASASYPCQVRRRPLPGWTRRVALPFITVIVGSIAATAFSAGSAVPLAGLTSSWLDPSLSWPSRPDPSIPLIFYRGHDHPDRRRHVRCRRPLWRGSSTTEREKKQEGPRPAGVLLLLRRPTDC